jgi:uncharacterized phiE125 gp8 family phage protein
MGPQNGWQNVATVEKHLNAAYTVTVEPTAEPITLNELKDRLRVTTCDFDTELAQLGEAGRKQVEYDAHTKLMTQTLTLSLDDFPIGDVIELRQLPVSSVTSITYIDEDVASQTFSSALYRTELNGQPARIVLLEDQSWEDVEPRYPAAVTVTFVAGYATAAAVPVEAKLAIVEWCRMHWGDCDGDGAKYKNLINSIAWSGYWKSV